MNASAHRANARDALRGRWVAAIVVALIGAIFGISRGINVNLNVNNTGGSISFGQVYTPFPAYLQTFLHENLGMMMETVALIATIWTIIQLVVGGAVQLGVCRYNLNLIDRTEAVIDDVLAGMPLFGRALLWQLLTILLMVPGALLMFLALMTNGIVVLLAGLGALLTAIIWVTYSFAMTPYILLEDPDCGAWQAMKRSSKMMKGHKWALFCLELSFLGWGILAAFTFGIGTLFLNPYIHAANASFYRSLQNQGYAPEL